MIILSIYMMMPYHGIISEKLIVVPELDMGRKYCKILGGQVM